MLKKTIKYKDLDGKDAEVDAYFNLTKAEALELNIRNDLEVIGRAKNKNEIMDTFHRILRMAYGVKTGTGHFVKVNPQGAPLYYEFQSTEAYSELFIEIFSSTEYALEFIKAILPKEFDADAAESQAKVPEALKNHPSMQGYRSSQVAQSTPDYFEPVEVRNENPSMQAVPSTPGPEYEEFLRWRDRQVATPTQTPPDQVSLPEVSQTTVTPRDELI